MDDTSIDDPTVGDLDGSNNNEENELHVFEEDTVTDDNVTDPITIEEQGENDDPIKLLNVPEEEYGNELGKRTFDGTSKQSNDDRQGGGGGARDVYEGTADDLYNEQEDAADQASDDM
jgi:hypothetical protein